MIGNMCNCQSENKERNTVCNKVQETEKYQHLKCPDKFKEFFESNQMAYPCPTTGRETMAVTESSV